jgi:hypothetical protein
LIEAYDLDGANPASLLANIATRGVVQSGNDVLIAGFILGGTQGSVNVVVRGIGPTLTQSGISGPIPNPTLSLHDANGTVVAANDNWQDDSVAATAISAKGLAPLSNLESAIFVHLAPGAYTALLSDKTGTSGVGLAEVYNLQ